MEDWRNYFHITFYLTQEIAGKNFFEIDVADIYDLEDELSDNFPQSLYEHLLKYGREAAFVPVYNFLNEHKQHDQLAHRKHRVELLKEELLRLESEIKAREILKNEV